MNKELYTLLLSHVCANYNDDDIALILSELSVVFGFKGREYANILADEMSYERLQQQLSVINEKQSIRKNNGVYYTPLDLVDFMTASAIKAAYSFMSNDGLMNNNSLMNNNGNTDNHNLKTDNSPFDKQLSLVPAKDFCFNKTCFDPTCGTGEFLVHILNLKYQLASINQLDLSLTDIREIAKTIYGNDINPESITITHLRLFLVVLQRFGTDSIKGFFNAIASNFTAHDFVSKPAKSKHHIVIGNPPFVEQSKYQGQLNERFGNIYANIILNAAHSLTEDGAFAFVIPISYTATPRMKAIRVALFDVLTCQYILSYADRPDCLFTGVHQKLCIVIAKKSNTPALYTSNYHYWYRSERKDLFNGVSVIRNPYQVDGFIPKLGSDTDVSVYQKVSIHAHKDQLNDSKDKDDHKVGATDTPITLKDLLSFDEVPLYLNMRACFWIKAFLSEHSGGEYKRFGCQDIKHASLAFCLLNSSLYWWHWVCISDCWHITGKELSSVVIPNTITIQDYAKALRLTTKLEHKLYDTKKFVGTKQTDYEYKHKLCLPEIDRIDNFINTLYGLSAKESEYIKSFARKYRAGEDSTK